LGNGNALPSWLTFNAATRTFSGTPPLNFNGAIDLRVTASDGALSANDTFTLTVTPVNDAPVITSAAPVIDTVAGAINAFIITAIDVDGDDLTFTAGAAGKGVVTVSGSDITYRADAFASGTDTFTITVADGNGGTASQTVAIAITAAPLPPPAFRFILTEGWAGAIGGNGLVSGSNGFDDLTLLGGALALDGSFNRGGDVVRFDGAASGYFVARDGASAAIITDNADLRVTIPLGTSGLITSFDDGTRTLVFSDDYRLGTQIFDADLAPITAPDDDATSPGLADPAAQATLVMLGAALQPGQDANAAIGGNVQVRGTNGTDIIEIAETGGTFIFDGSFNRGGDVIVLSQDASAYTAIRLGSSMLLTSDDESLTIPVGLVGLTLRFADGDRVLVFEEGEFRIGDQVITGDTPAQLDAGPASSSILPSTDAQDMMVLEALLMDSVYTPSISPEYTMIA
jgi:hypothetical protein